MPIAWPAHILPSAIGVGLIGGICGAVLGTFVAVMLKLRAGYATDRARLGLGRSPRCSCSPSPAACCCPPSSPTTPARTVTLTEVTGSPNRTVNATVRFTPKDAANDADWLRTIAWQGNDGPLVTDELQRISEGVYRTTAPLPVDGTWKTAIRLHRGTVLGFDPGVPAGGQGHPGRGRSRVGEVHAHVRDPTSRCFSASARTTSRRGCGAWPACSS